MIAVRSQELSKATAPPSGQARQQANPPTEKPFNPLWGQVAMSVRPKRVVSARDDPDEREADRVAADVMRMPEPGASARGHDAPHELSASRGMPLPASALNFFEPRLGADLSTVRVHDGSQADAAARAVAAHAFTFGRHVVFRAGAYRPDDAGGQRLLAHELVHVVQQREGARVGLQRKESTEEERRAEAKHREAQKWVYGLLEPDSVWDYARRGMSDPRTLKPEEKAKDPHIIFNNSVEWIRSKRIPVNVLSRVPGQPETADPVTLFDPTVNYPDVGGSVERTIEDGKKMVASFRTKPVAKVVVAPRPETTQDELRELIRHEIQHATPVYADEAMEDEERRPFQDEAGVSPKLGDPVSPIWNTYQREFNGYWIGSITRPGFQAGIREDGTPMIMGGSGGVDHWGSPTTGGGELKVSGPPPKKDSPPLYVPEASIQLDNEKQTKIANHIVHNYFGMEPTFLRSPIFRARIEALTKPIGLNLVNSIRIDQLRLAMAGPAVRKSLLQRKVTREEDVSRLVRRLDDTDRAFLSDRNASEPFWEYAKRQMSADFVRWMEDYIQRGNTTAPPPLPATE